MVEIDDTLRSGDPPLAEPGSEEPTLPADSVPPVGGDFADLAEVSRDNYEIGREIARGGMGRIVAARDRRAGRPIVIKEVRSDLLAVMGDRDREALVRRFKREAMLTARLQHPSVVPVYEIGRFEDTPFIAMKRVDGTPLLDLLISARTLADRLALLPRVIAVAEAIAYAHAEGVVHRDLKPANILVGAYGETVVIDWGLAKLAGESDEAISVAAPVPGDVETVAGAIFGTPAYMAPEQAAGEPVGPAADVYAIGAILYQLLAGKAPYHGDVDPRELVARVRDQPPASVTELASDAPADLVSIVEKAMARDPADRYASAGELATDLGSFQRGQLVEVHDYSTWDLVRRWVARRRALVITALVLTAAGAAATSWFVVQTIAARDQARREEARAEAQLRSAMETTYERGKRELLVDRRRAIASLATAYRHLDDPLLSRELGEALLGLEGFRGELDLPDSAIEDVALSPDGRRAAVVSNRRLRLFDLESHRVLAESEAREPRFASGGEYLVGLEGEGAAIWNARTGERLGLIEFPLATRTFYVVGRYSDLMFVISDRTINKGHVFSIGERRLLFDFPIDTVYVGSVRFSADGQRVMVGHPVTKVFTRAGELIYRGGTFNFETHTALAPDGASFAVSDAKGISIRSVATGEERTKIRPLSFEMSDMSFSRRGDKLLVSTVGHACVVSVASGKKLACHETVDAGPQISFTPDFERVVNARQDGSVEIWEGSTGRVRAVLAAHSDGAPDVDISDDGTVLITAGLDGAVRLWDADTDILTAAIDHGDQRYVLSDYSDLVALAGETRLTLWDPDKPAAAVATLETETPLGTEAAVAAGGVIAAWAGHSWEPLTGRRLAAIEGWENLHVIAIDPAGQTLAGCGLDGFVYAHDPRSGARRWRVDLGELLDVGSSRQSLMLCAPVFSPDGAQLIVRTPGLDLVLDPRTGGLARRLDHSRRGNALNFSAAFFADHGYAAADGTQIYLWDLATGERLDTFGGRARGLVTHPDNRRLLLPLTEANVVLDPKTGARTRLATTAFPRGSAAFSRDGTLVAVGGLADRVEIYDVASGRQIGRRAPGFPLQHLSFSRGGNLVVTGSRQTFIWSLPVEVRSAGEVDRALARGLDEAP